MVKLSGFHFFGLRRGKSAGPSARNFFKGHARPKVLFGFDFYGAGNVGDDLMLAGFLRGVRKYHCDGTNFFCFLPAERLASQRMRFPEIQWRRNWSVFRAGLLRNCVCWIGVGDTPFQVKSGPWMLDQMLMDIAGLKGRATPMLLLGVGVETEAEEAKDKVVRIVDRIDRIWTRDEVSRDFLIKMAKNGKRTAWGSDLAHLALRELFSGRRPQRPRRYDLAVNYYSEDSDGSEIPVLRDFLVGKSGTKSIVCVANETRKGMNAEYDVYKSLFPDSADASNRGIGFFAPDYGGATVAQLVGHFSDYKTVMASRYHALLTAAWAGCKVAALERSSKIRTLADELGIPHVGRPFTAARLSRGLASAKRVDRKKLEALAERADASVRACLRAMGAGAGFGAPSSPRREGDAP